MQTFPCPNCSEIVNETMDVCNFCSVPIDKGIAALAAERQSRVNLACSDASFLKSASVAMYVLLVVSLVPFLGIIYWGFLGTFVVVLVLLIRWQIRAAGVVTKDPDFARARNSWIVALVLWLLAFPAGLIGPMIASVFIRLLIGS